MIGKINYNNIDLWLEPWIGWEVEIVKITKSFVWFKWNVGLNDPIIKKEDRNKIDLISV
jgi:hypothetical protein